MAELTQFLSCGHCTKTHCHLPQKGVSRDVLLKSPFLRMNTSKKKWAGHSGTVLALDTNANGLLSSVSEDGRCILWTSEGEIVSDICVNEGAGSTAATTSSLDECPLNSVKFVPNDPEKFFISSGKTVLGYDARKCSSSFIKFEFNREEINQVSVNDTAEYLAACDDDGEVKVIDLRQNRLFKTLSRRHTNICSSVQFRHQKPWQLVTAGMDCNIIHWDFSSGKSRHIVNMNELFKDKQLKSELFINPPFAHSLSVTKNGGKFAVGLGSGEIGLFSFKSKGFHCLKTFKAHDLDVSQVHYMDLDGTSSDCLLISGGNDGKVNVWKESSNEQEDNLLHHISHGSKINWITFCSLSKTIYIADQSTHVNAYKIY